MAIEENINNLETMKTPLQKCFKKSEKVKKK